MYFLVQNEQLEPVLIHMKSSLCHVAMQLIDSISASRVSRTQYYYWSQNRPTILAIQSRDSNVHFAPNSRAVFNGEKDCGRAF